MRYRVGPTAGSVATFPSSSQSPSRGGDASAGREYKDERGRSDAWRSVAGGLLRRYFRAASRLPTTRCRPASVRCYRSSAKRAASQRRIDCPQMRPLGRVPVFGAAPDGLSDPGGTEAIRCTLRRPDTPASEREQPPRGPRSRLLDHRRLRLRRASASDSGATEAEARCPACSCVWCLRLGEGGHAPIATVRPS